MTPKWTTGMLTVIQDNNNIGSPLNTSSKGIVKIIVLSDISNESEWWTVNIFQMSVRNYFIKITSLHDKVTGNGQQATNYSWGLGTVSLTAVSFIFDFGC